MASPTSHPPEVIRSVERLLEREVKRMDNRRDELREARDDLRSLLHQAPIAPMSQRADIEAVPAEMASAVAVELIEELGGRGMLRYVASAYEFGRGLEDERVRDLQTRMGREITSRAVYPLSVLDDPAGRRWIEVHAETGEEQRFLADPPGDFVIIGSLAVLANAQWNAPGSDSVVLRDPMLIHAFTALYDTTYSIAVPLRSSREQVADNDRLVDLMGLGLKDEAIARTLGTSLRTVRRRIAGLMDEYGVDTRFQLGAALNAQHRLAAGPPPSPRRGSRRTLRTPPRR